jgi:hypothetical protein
VKSGLRDPPPGPPALGNAVVDPKGVGDGAGGASRVHDDCAGRRIAVVSATGLDLGHQQEPVVLGEVDEVVVLKIATGNFRTRQQLAVHAWLRACIRRCSSRATSASDERTFD